MKLNLHFKYIACEEYTKLSNPFLSFNILGGVPTGLGEFPHMAALGYPSQDTPDYEYAFDCGGSIISDIYILTAAHCVTSRNTPVVVRMGKITLHTNDDGTEGITSNIAVKFFTVIFSEILSILNFMIVHNTGNYITSQLSKDTTIQ